MKENINFQYKSDQCVVNKVFSWSCHWGNVVSCLICVLPLDYDDCRSSTRWPSQTNNLVAVIIVDVIAKIGENKLIREYSGFPSQIGGYLRNWKQFYWIIFSVFITWVVNNRIEDTNFFYSITLFSSYFILIYLV